MVVDKWIEETISGNKDVEKRKLGGILDTMQKDDILICAELSRLGRNLLMIMAILNQCMKREVQVWTIKDNYRLGSDINSKVLAFAFGLSAEIERNLISQRTKEALARKKAEGVILGRPKGSKSKTKKLTGREAEIQELLNKRISKSAIARILGVHRLTVAGYLKTPKKELQADGSYLCEVSIPNREIAAVYKSEILSHFLQTGAITRTTANKIAESLYANDYKKLQSAIGEYMDKSISFFDGGAEGFYHGLMLGLIALMDNQYKIKSNRESGDGRFDVSLIPREKRYPGIILELKWKEKLSDVELEKWSNEALKQIGELRYDSEMKEDGITEILKFGIAFSGKKVCVRTE